MLLKPTGTLECLNAFTLYGINAHFCVTVVSHLTAGRLKLT